MSSRRTIISTLLALAISLAGANSASNDRDGLAVAISRLRVQLRQVEPKSEQCRLLATDLDGDQQLSPLLQTAGGLQPTESSNKLLIARDVLKQRLDNSASSSQLRVLIDWLDECIQELGIQQAERKDNRPREFFFSYEDLERIQLPEAAASSNGQTTTAAPPTSTTTNPPRELEEEPQVDIDGLIEAATWPLQQQIDLLTDKLDNKQATIEKLEERIRSFELARNGNQAGSDDKQATVEKLEGRIKSLEAARNANRAEMQRLSLDASNDKQATIEKLEERIKSLEAARKGQRAKMLDAMDESAALKIKEGRLTKELQKCKEHEMSSGSKTNSEMFELRYKNNLCANHLKQCRLREINCEGRAQRLADQISVSFSL